MPALTQAKFLNYQNIFYRNVIMSPMIISLGIQTETPSVGNSLQDFVGGNAPQTGYPTTWYDFPALYRNQTEPFIREDFGLSELEDGSVYLSPLQLIPVFGDYKLDPAKLLVKLGGHEYMVNYIDFKEPLFGTCLFVVINLRDSIRG